MTFSLWPVLLHCSAAGVMVWAFNWLNQSFPLGALASKQYGWHYPALTVLGLHIAFLAMIVGLLVDFAPSFKGRVSLSTNPATVSQALRTLKRALIMVAMPVEAVIASIYWTLITFFPSLIKISATVDGTPVPFLPLSIDLSLHAIPGIALVADFLLLEKKYSQRTVARYSIPTMVACTVSYGAWVEWCAHINGYFTYPFLTNNPFPIRLCIYAGGATVGYLSFRILNAIHS
ncbi:FAR-17a/AIG1-like protein [Desarmillaria tabescens]|uniref:FAR-17a/AIG1-like protein n=1 Tax=Armillaria tabescens TaxID=1929756 RepID=A0AA39NNP9_ARMTA|nr:FAR-17a/AIG1-like protein [Desarmillaria tabescens]KAK0468981.1 FAR-17a/AIG1-like protein [Desarmillaria tabescens]